LIVAAVEDEFAITLGEDAKFQPTGAAYKEGVVLQYFDWTVVGNGADSGLERFDMCHAGLNLDVTWHPYLPPLIAKLRNCKALGGRTP
jgi:hypothetical protein